MNQQTWSPQERAEWEAALEQAATETETTTEAAVMLAALVDDAYQAQRPWADDVQRTALHDGLRKQVNDWKKRSRLLMSHDGRVLNRPRAVGITRVDEDGTTWTQQELIQTVSFDLLRAKRAEYLKQIDAYRDNVAVIDRLLTLQARCPEAITPQEACDRLGLDLDDYLMDEAA
jgi:hypothetical protein